MPNSFVSAPLLSKGSNQNLRLESTLQELLLHDCQIDFHHLGRDVNQIFQANPLLPGVILTDQGQFAGMISRRQFLEHMSRPYGLELFSQRPIECLYRFARNETVILPGDTRIVAAAHRSLQRPAELLYEPIVVQLAPQVYRLLDVHQLLLAQSQIHELATELLSQLYQHLEAANQQLLLLASFDGLTQVANRRRFNEYLEQEWRRLAEENAPLSLILCDIDWFKKYNDTYGHLAGDFCLQQVAAAIQHSVKRSQDLVARYGGEEFAVILPNTLVADAVGIAEEIRHQVEVLKITHAQSTVSPYVTLSLGVASMVPLPEASPESLIAAADEALYQAKKAGRNRVMTHTSLKSAPRY